MSMTLEEQMDLIRSVLDEAGELRALTDAQLEAFYAQAGGDPGGAIYLGALAKARADGATLPDGTSLPSNRDYWLGLAAAFRPNRGGAIPREGR
jgi:hypothetical protein